MSNICKEAHRYDGLFKSLPDDQGTDGRHRCSGCAYEIGLKAGKNLETNFNIPITALPESQAGTVRHKSVHAAFALGYQNGVKQHYAS